MEKAVESNHIPVHLNELKLSFDLLYNPAERSCPLQALCNTDFISLGRTVSVKIFCLQMIPNMLNIGFNWKGIRIVNQWQCWATAHINNKIITDVYIFGTWIYPHYFDLSSEKM